MMQGDPMRRDAAQKLIDKIKAESGPLILSQANKLRLLDIMESDLGGDPWQEGYSTREYCEVLKDREQA